MSADRTVYIGCYLRVWMPKEKQTSLTGRCPKCRNIASGVSYCALCGSKLVFGEIEVLSSFYNFCERVFGKFGKTDVFFSPEGHESNGYEVVLANLPSQSGYHYVAKHDGVIESKIPKEDWSGDWTTLIEALQSESIPHEKHFGIVSYWS